MSRSQSPLHMKDSAALRRTLVSMVTRLLPALMMAGLGFALASNSGCRSGGIFPEITATATATTVPTLGPSASATASPAAATRSIELRGSGSETTSHAGTCSGQTCGGSLHDCECVEFSGKLISTLVGSASWTADITINIDDCTNTGTAGGFCCNGDGVLNATSGSGAAESVLSLSVTGPLCTDPVASASSLESNYSVLGGTSSGKFANAAGTGQFNIYSDSSGNAYLAALGEIQLAP
jgi:hypothetical protein